MCGKKCIYHTCNLLDPTICRKLAIGKNYSDWKCFGHIIILLYYSCTHYFAFIYNLVVCFYSTIWDVHYACQYCHTDSHKKCLYTCIFMFKYCCMCAKCIFINVSPKWINNCKILDRGREVMKVSLIIPGMKSEEAISKSQKLKSPN